jgi:hypothetical protein
MDLRDDLSPAYERQSFFGNYFVCNERIKKNWRFHRRKYDIRDGMLEFLGGGCLDAGPLSVPAAEFERRSVYGDRKKEFSGSIMLSFISNTSCSISKMYLIS